MATLIHKTATEVSEEKKQSLIARAKAECTRRIEAEWNPVGQLNASLGIYPEEQQQACRQWIEHHRSRLQELTTEIERGGEVDVTADEWWE